MASTLLKIAAIAAAGFFRAGRFFPKDGVTIPVGEQEPFGHRPHHCG